MLFNWHLKKCQNIWTIYVTAEIVVRKYCKKPYKPFTSLDKRKPPPFGGTSGCAGGDGYPGERGEYNGHDSCGGWRESSNPETNQRNECCHKTAGHEQITVAILEKN